MSPARVEAEEDGAGDRHRGRWTGEAGAWRRPAGNRAPCDSVPFRAIRPRASEGLYEGRDGGQSMERIYCIGGLPTLLSVSFKASRLL